MDDLPETPLVGVSSPLEFLPRIASAYDFLSIAFTVIFIIWAIYTVVSIYHWVRYGHQSWVAVPAIAAHFVVSGFLMLFATAGFR